MLKRFDYQKFRIPSPFFLSNIHPSCIMKEKRSDNVESYSTLNELFVNMFHEIMDIEEKALITSEFGNISNNDMHIIEAIGVGEPRNMSSVAKTLSVTMGTLTIAINSLVKKGYVNRVRSEEDRRVVLISLSDIGRKAYEHHRRFHEDMIRATLEGLSEEEAKILTGALKNLMKFFQRYQ